MEAVCAEDFLYIFQMYWYDSMQHVVKYGAIMVIITVSNEVTFPYNFEANDPKFNGIVIFNEVQRIIQEM